MPADGPRSDEHVVGEEDLVAVGVDGPLLAPAQRHDPHAHLGGELQVGQGAVRHGRVLPDPDPVGDLLGGGQVGHQGVGDARGGG